MPYFSASEVEAALWTWIKSVLTNPKQLNEGLKQYHNQQAQTTAPLREQLKVGDDLLAENQGQLERLLDLYLKGNFPEEMLIDRKSRLETTIKHLKEEKARLNAHLEAKTLTEGQVQVVKEFAEKVQEGLVAAEDSFEQRRQLIDMLDVQVRLAIEDEKKIAYVQCRLGKKVLSVVSLALYEKFW